MKFNRLRRLGALALALVLALSLAVTPAWADDPDATPDPNTPVSVALESHLDRRRSSHQGKGHRHLPGRKQQNLQQRKSSPLVEQQCERRDSKRERCGHRPV